MVRAPCCEKMGLKKGPWTIEEDRILISYIQRNGHSNWRALPKQAGLLRCGKSCRLRWINYLKPDIKRGNFTHEEEETIIKLHETLGNRWSAIAAKLPGRTDNEIKNVWHTHLKKRLINNERTQPEQSKRQKKSSACSSDTQSTPVKCEAGGKGQTEGSKCNGDSECNAKSVQGGGASPDRSFSDDVSSSMITEAATASSTGELVLNLSSPEYFLEIDESFWSDAALSCDDNSVAAPSSFEYGSGEVGSGSAGFGYDEGNVRDEMDFWYHMFIRTAGQPDLDLGEF